MMNGMKSSGAGARAAIGRTRREREIRGQSRTWVGRRQARGTPGHGPVMREDSGRSPVLADRQLEPGTGWRWWLVGLFCLALAWRLLWVYRLAHTPLADSLNADAQAYWDWASFLRKNGLLRKNPFFIGPLYPYALTVLRAIFGDSIPPILVAQ